MKPEHSRSQSPPVIGWVEYVSLPSWRITDLRAKMDTGARTSALHVENIVELGHGMVRFDVVLDKRNRRRTHVSTKIRRRARVRSSNGEYSTRIFVTTTLRVGPNEQSVEFNLVDRGRMIHRVLLGRTALEGFLVDVRRRYQLGRRRKPTRRKLRN